MYFDRSRPGSVATTVCAGAFPDFASSAKATRTFPPAASFSRSGAVSLGDTAKTGTVHVPRNRFTTGQPEADARPSTSTAAHPAVDSGVGLAAVRQTAPGRVSRDSAPSPFPDGAPELGQVVLSAAPGVPASSRVARISHDAGWYQLRGASSRTVTSRPAWRNSDASQAAAS